MSEILPTELKTFRTVEAGQASYQPLSPEMHASRPSVRDRQVDTGVLGQNKQQQPAPPPRTKGKPITPTRQANSYQRQNTPTRFLRCPVLLEVTKENMKPFQAHHRALMGSPTTHLGLEVSMHSCNSSTSLKKEKKKKDIAPIPKPKEPVRYRPISLLSCLGKTAKSLVLNRL